MPLKYYDKHHFRFQNLNLIMLSGQVWRSGRAVQKSLTKKTMMAADVFRGVIQVAEIKAVDK